MKTRGFASPAAAHRPAARAGAVAALFVGTCLGASAGPLALEGPAPRPAAGQEAREGAAPDEGRRGVPVTGTVTSEHGKKPIVGAEVQVIGRPQVARTDGAGRFTLGPLPPGTHLLSINALGYASGAKQIVVGGGEPIEVAIVLDLLRHEERLVVTAAPYSPDPIQVAHPTGVLGAKELEQRAAVSLGATLQNEPGISTTSLGTAPARPVIRGLGGDRVLVLEDGMRIGDVSSISPDHGVAADPGAAARIEIVRGPANLLYGSEAIGGVINVINGEIPTRLVQRPTGTLLVGGGSNAGELTTSADIDFSAGPLAWRVSGSHREGDEFEFRDGVAGNSDYDVDSGSVSMAWIGSAGRLGVSYRPYEATYGIPVDEDQNPLGEGEEGVSIDMEQDSAKFVGEITRPFGPFSAGRLQAVRRDYKHAEVEETGEIGTRFDLDTTEVRADLTHRTVGRLKGTFGLWRLDQEFRAEGEEVLVPAAENRGYAGFFYEELGFDRVSYLFGGRYERRTVEADLTSGTEDRSFGNVSAAAGAVVRLGGPVSLAVNATRSVKAPSIEELYASGPHVATATHEIGDPDLDEESSRGLDLAVRFKTRRFEGEVTLFRTRFDDFIFLRPNGMTNVDSGLPEAVYVQADADFQGVEFHGDIHLAEHFVLELVADAVRGENLDLDEPLPHITPARVGVGLTWESDRYFVGGEVRAVARQDRVASDISELETGGYTLYNLFGGCTVASKGLVHRFGLRAENLTDTLYRNHVSLTKDIVPQPGRNVQITYRLLF